MAQVIATSFMRLICDKLGNKVMSEFGILLGVDKELKKLENTLSVIQDVIEDAEQQQVKERALKNWLKKLKDLAYEIDDLLDEVAAKALKRKAKLKVGLKEKVRNFPSMPNSIISRAKIGHEIKEIRRRLDEVAEERFKFHLREGTTKNVELDATVREQTCSLIDETEVYGRQEEKEHIINFLVSNSEDNDLEVIAIVGMGGLGKTTLAQLVYNDQKVRRHFEKLIWICVSDGFDTMRVTRSIFESVTGQKCNIDTMDVMQRSLREKLQGKRFLLVFDDVWNEDYERWDRLRILLRKCATGSKVVVTTRSKRVASLMGTVAPHFLTALSDDDCWLLFKRRAFEPDHDKHHQPNLLVIGKEILKKCGGVPLAAKALGSLLRFKQSESEWLAIRDNEIWRTDEDDNIFAALMLSYNHLPSHLKQCFAYCSIFPKGMDIRVKTLVRLWIAEGFVWSNDNKMNLEDLGTRYVDELLSRSLFEDGMRSTDDAPTEVKLHDLIYELAQFISNDALSVVYAGADRDASKMSRYLCFQYDRQTSINNFLQCGSRLRSLYALVSENFKEVLDDDQNFIDALFYGMKRLRSLHLSSFPMRTVPDSAYELTHMRYLNLSNTKIEALPQCISSLSNLLILDLSSCTSLRNLPESIGDLFNLSILNLHDCMGLESLPNSVGNLKNLQDLDVSFAPIETLPESVGPLTKLQNLGLRYCYWLKKLPDRMKEMKSLVHLDIHRCCQLTFMPLGLGELNQLRTLPFYVLSDDKMHGGLAELNALNLTGELCIKNVENVRKASEASQANLKEKRGLRSLELVWNSSSTESLPEKVSQDIGCMKQLMALFEKIAAEETRGEITLTEEVFESLQPPKNLQVLSIEGYSGEKLPGWMAKLYFPNICELKLDNFIRCQQLPSFGHLATLKVLKLNMLPYVVELPALGQLPCLRVLKLFFLPGISSLGSEFYGANVAFCALEELELGMLLGLEEWLRLCEDQEFLPCLTKLTLYGCPNLKSLPSLFNSLNELDMHAHDELLLSYLEIGAFRNLKKLYVNDFGEDENDEGTSKPLPEVLAQRLDELENYHIRNISDTGVSNFCRISIKGGTTIIPLL